VPERYAGFPKSGYNCFCMCKFKPIFFLPSAGKAVVLYHSIFYVQILPVLFSKFQLYIAAQTNSRSWTQTLNSFGVIYESVDCIVSSFLNDIRWNQYRQSAYVLLV